MYFYFLNLSPFACVSWRPFFFFWSGELVSNFRVKNMQINSTWNFTILKYIWYDFVLPSVKNLCWIHVAWIGRGNNSCGCPRNITWGTLVYVCWCPIVINGQFLVAKNLNVYDVSLRLLFRTFPEIEWLRLYTM